MNGPTRLLRNQGVTAPAGFRAAGIPAGIKVSGAPDLALVFNEGPDYAAAGVFTRNQVKAAPVLWSAQVLTTGRLRAVLLNSGGANACTGPAGFADTHATAEAVAATLSNWGTETGPIEVAVCSTGLIGDRLPMDRVLAGVTEIVHELAGGLHGGEDAARAIMTTDTVPKQVALHHSIESGESIRGSDVDAALHYLARMLVAGEDPRFVARRLVILASEDIGMADPTALLTAVAAAQTVALIGMPEAQLTLAHATVHLATAPKSNAVTTALGAAIGDIRSGKAGMVPAHLRDGHYSGAARLGNAQGYRYPHDDPDGVVPQQYPPDEVVGVDYYAPTGHGAEREIGGRVNKLRAIIRRKRP